MSKARILIVEDEIDMLKALQLFFESQGYEVLVAKRGEEAIGICRIRLPNVVILDIKLPGIDGHEVYRRLRDNNRTDHIPILFLTQKDERSDRLAGLELGADDYITKPFDMEELKWRVEKSVRSSRRGALNHPITNLPSGNLVEDHLQIAKRSGKTGALLYFNLRDTVTAADIEGILISLADLICETVETYGTQNDFIGQVSDHQFVLTTTPEAAPAICKVVIQRFNEQWKQVVKLTCSQVKL
jgi:DNA-binding response OmpR family regulator